VLRFDVSAGTAKSTASRAGRSARRCSRRRSDAPTRGGYILTFAINLATMESTFVILDAEDFAASRWRRELRGGALGLHGKLVPEHVKRRPNLMLSIVLGFLPGSSWPHSASTRSFRHCYCRSLPPRSPRFGNSVRDRPRSWTLPPSYSRLCRGRRSGLRGWRSRPTCPCWVTSR